MKSKIIAFTVLTLVSSFVHAQSPVYIDVMIGTADQTEKFSAGNIEGDELSIGLRLGANVFSILSVEAGYHDYGEFTDTVPNGIGGLTNETVETTSLNLGLKGSLPIFDFLTVDARVGAFHWDYEFRTFTAVGGFSGEDDGTDVYYGLGATADLTETTAVSIEYTVLDHEAEFNGLVFDREVRNISFAMHYTL